MTQIGKQRTCDRCGETHFGAVKTGFGIDWSTYEPPKGWKRVMIDGKDIDFCPECFADLERFVNAKA